MRRRYWSALLALPAVLWVARPLFIRGAVGGVELRVEPGRQRLHPYDTATIRIHFTTPSGATPGRGVTLRVVEKDGGWLSRPFRAGAETAVLYTAPGKPGRYTVESQWSGAKSESAFEISLSAPSRRSGESVAFGPESAPHDFYRDLAEHYAPLVCQETWFEPKADFLARFDFDGDWRGDNNWDDLTFGSSQAYVYYAAMETATHYFLIYNFFHPRHYSDDCSGGACYENDNSGLLLAVRKDGGKYGKPQAMETLAQSSIYSYTADSHLRDGAHQVNGELKLWKESHPMVFIEGGRHGVFGAADKERSRFSPDRMEFTGSTGVVYRFGGGPSKPAHACDREVSYELLSILEQWWPRATSQEGAGGRTFDEYFHYAPFGRRPGAAASEIAGAFFGRKYLANQARPFWAWSDAVALNRKLLALGQWGLDPAYALSVTLKLPSGSPFSLDYIYNPYLESVRRNAITALPLNGGGESNGTARLAQAPSVPPRPAPGGQRQLLSAPAEKPNYNLKSRSGQLEFRARVDGAIYLLIHGDQIEVEYLSGRPIDEIRYRFSQPLPTGELDDMKLDDVEGRGSLRLLEWPNAGNQFTAKIRIQDDKAGAGIYRFKLGWKR